MIDFRIFAILYQQKKFKVTPKPIFILFIVMMLYCLMSDFFSSSRLELISQKLLNLFSFQIYFSTSSIAPSL